MPPEQQRSLRILIPIIVIGLALGVVLVGVVSRPSTPTPPQAAAERVTPDAAVAGTPASDAGSAGGSGAGSADGQTDASNEETAEETRTGHGDPDRAPGEPVALSELRAIAPPTGTSGHDTPPASLGDLDPAVARALVELSRVGAGIERITFANIWETASANRQAEEYHAAIDRGDPPPRALPPASLRYVLTETQTLGNATRAPVAVPVLAARAIEVNGESVNLFDYDRGEGDVPVYIWAETGPGVFETLVVNDADEPVLRITRRFVLGDNYDLTIEQRVHNLTGAEVRVRWSQYGPSSLRIDRSRYMDRRRARMAALRDVERDPQRLHVLADNDLLLERRDVMKLWKKAGAETDPAERYELVRLWPNKTSLERDYELSWFALTNRYFGLAVHPIVDESKTSTSLATKVEDILLEVSTLAEGPATAEAKKVIFTYLNSPEHTIAPYAELALDLGVFAGPLQGQILDDEAPYKALSMNQLILFQMSSFCAVCTFQWLAHGLLWFLSFLQNSVVLDWGFAIIGLVVVVRLLLHPITKKSQIGMQRFGKQMGEMKPELDKIQKKFPNDPKKLQQEQMRLMREHGMNPLQMLGCLPMFLQTPIWIALYAMLYFTFDLRQEPAFFGIFQSISGGRWPFLSDLSSADHFFGEFTTPFRFFMWNMTGINLLPIMMGGIFFVQQKYMSPPPSPTMTDDQRRQQKIMKIMMVVLFPVMLYSAPSGLTLYILTSSTIGILESRYVRKHITEMDLKPAKPKRAGTKPKDAQGRAYAAAIARADEKRRKQRTPDRQFKKRK